MTPVQRQRSRDARDSLPAILDRAERDYPTIITRNGRDIAAVVSVDMLRQFEEYKEAELNRIIDKRLDLVDPIHGATLEDVMNETLARRE